MTSALAALESVAKTMVDPNADIILGLPRAILPDISYRAITTIHVERLWNTYVMMESEYRTTTPIKLA